MQKLPENSIQQRLEFCNKMLQKIELNPNFLNKIWFTDESHFHIDGHCNKQNMRIWGTEKPETYVEKSAHPEYVTVRSAIFAQGFIGPYFFKNSSSERIRINQFFYTDMIENYLFQNYGKGLGAI